MKQHRRGAGARAGSAGRVAAQTDLRMRQAARRATRTSRIGFRKQRQDQKDLPMMIDNIRLDAELDFMYFTEGEPRKTWCISDVNEQLTAYCTQIGYTPEAKPSKQDGPFGNNNAEAKYIQPVLRAFALSKKHQWQELHIGAKR